MAGALNFSCQRAGRKLKLFKHRLPNSNLKRKVWCKKAMSCADATPDATTSPPFIRNHTMALRRGNEKTYEETVAALNSLQTNTASSVAPKSQYDAEEKGKEMLVQLEATGVGSSKLNQLSVIHVTGTKGKGSTCSLCETILRKNGFTTGLFSSPHLVSVRERIQINGKPLEEKQFVKYFWDVMDDLMELKETEAGLPPYFRFILIMALNVFLKEQVDVAIIEVGIGGQYDATNILPSVAVVGISNIGLDHTNVLGSTIAKIAWHKAGIMKPCAIAFTVPDQDPVAMEVVQARSKELNCPLVIVPSLDKLTWPNREIKNSVLKLATVETNVALALQLAGAWILRKGNNNTTDALPLLQVEETSAKALETWCLPGRMQTLHGDENMIYFLDGAHTPESMRHCIHWFSNASGNLSSNKRQVLICNIIGSRDFKSILGPLYMHQFSDVFFTPNISELNGKADKGERWSARESGDLVQRRLLELEDIWLEGRPLDIGPSQNVTKVHSFAEALEEIKLMSLQSPNIKWHVLITGSLHLVGCALSLLDPTLQRSYSTGNQTS